MTSTAVNCLINGRPSSRLGIADRGLRYGDGLFRTIRVVNGHLIDLERHISHLIAGCERLGLMPPVTPLLRTELNWLAEGMTDGALRCTVTRGPGERGYGSLKAGPTTRIIERHPRNSDIDLGQGVRTRWCETPASICPATAGIKTLNRLDQVLARSEWSDPEISEGLMRDADGHVTGGTMSNLFAVRDGILMTPRLERSGIRGVQREWILEQASRTDIRWRCADLLRSDVEQADELFLTNALIGIWPVTRLDNRRYSIGPVTRQLLELYEKTLAEFA